MQVEQTEELAERAKQRTSVVTSRASAVIKKTQEMGQTSEQQLEAFGKAKGMLTNVTAATEHALTAFRCRDPNLVFVAHELRVCVCYVRSVAIPRTPF